MEETIKLLRERSVLCARLPELFDELLEVVKNNSPDTQEIVRKIEAIIRDLSNNEQRTQKFLKSVKAKSLASYVSAQEKNIQRDVAEKLLRNIADSLLRLKNQSTGLNLLLQHAKKYIEFNLNMLARISASDTYGAEAQTTSQRSRRMFEANI